METSILVTDLAQQFPLSVRGHLSPCCRPLRVARAGRRGAAVIFAPDLLTAKKERRVMETSILVTDLAQQFSLSVVGPSHSVVVCGWPEQAGADFLILGLSFLSACQQLASSFAKRR
jgi:hypothetical protein